MRACERPVGCGAALAARSAPKATPLGSCLRRAHAGGGIVLRAPSRQRRIWRMRIPSAQRAKRQSKDAQARCDDSTGASRHVCTRSTDGYYLQTVVSRPSPVAKVPLCMGRRHLRRAKYTKCSQDETISLRVL